MSVFTMSEMQTYISSLKKAIQFNNIDSSSSGSQRSFHIFPLFSLLPAELRRKIWSHALPERIMEAKLCRQDNGWHYSSKTPTEKLDARKMPTLFSVNVESREFCLEQYVLFANHYIHPVLDTLYISWHQERSHAQCRKIEGKPLDKFESVILSAAHNLHFAGRFKCMMECIKDVGSPAAISLGLDGPKLPRMLSDVRGYSTATGHEVILLNWITHTPADTTPRKTLQEDVSDAFRAEEQAVALLKPPYVQEQLVYVYPGPQAGFDDPFDVL